MGSRVWGFWKQMKIQLLPAMPPSSRVTSLCLLIPRHTLHVPITSCIHTECLILREQTCPNNYVTTQNIRTV